MGGRSEGDREGGGVLVGDRLEGEVEAAGAGGVVFNGVAEMGGEVGEELGELGVLVAKDGDFSVARSSERSEPC